MSNFLSRFKLKPIEAIALIPVVIIVGLFAYGQFFTEEDKAQGSQVNPDIDQVRIYEFWLKTCPHCADANEFLEPYVKNNEQVIWKKYEVSSNENQQKRQKVANKLNIPQEKNQGVPMIIIGDKVFNGFGSAETTGQRLKDRVNYCLENTCPDKAAKALGLEPLGSTTKKSEASDQESSSSESNSDNASNTTQTTTMQNISPNKARSLINQATTEDNFQVLDIRTPQEVNQGVIHSDVTNLDFYKDNFSQNLDQLDKDKTYLMYCNSGDRSSQALEMMKNKGFQKVYNLEGGIQKWKNEGYDTVQVN
jgi:rhodanese-related sulfurtransferase/glutaredoxin